MARDRSYPARCAGLLLGLPIRSTCPIGIPGPTAYRVYSDMAVTSSVPLIIGTVYR
jgi:hypothetical protein